VAILAGLSALALALSGCATFARPSADPPPGVNFTGIWKLDPQLSTDVPTALQKIMPRRRGGPHGGGEDGGDEGGGLGQLGPRGPQVGGETFVMPIDISLQRSLLSGGGYLQIEQRTDEFIVSNGDTTNNYVPGENSVVSIPNGVAQRRSGWKKKAYWVELQPEYGPHVTEKFRLENGGKRLIETINVASDGRVRRLEVTRVYEPTRDVPTLLPLGN
jgi:hypothetical protein